MGQLESQHCKILFPIQRVVYFNLFPQNAFRACLNNVTVGKESFQFYEGNLFLTFTIFQWGFQSQCFSAGPKIYALCDRGLNSHWISLSLTTAIYIYISCIMYHAYFTTQILVTLFQTGYPDNWQKLYIIHISIVGNGNELHSPRGIILSHIIIRIPLLKGGVVTILH